MKLASCHSSRKAHARELCRNCYDKWLREKNPRYRKMQISRAARWARENPDRYAILQQRRIEKDRNDPTFRGRKRNRYLKGKYGITQLDYEMMLKRQRGGCAICTRKPSALTKQLHVDHNHKTGKVRGLLCHQCNWYLGVIDDNRKILAKLGRYIRRG